MLATTGERPDGALRKWVVSTAFQCLDGGAFADAGCAKAIMAASPTMSPGLE